MSGWRVEQISLSDKPYRSEDIEKERLAKWAALEHYLEVGWEPFAASTEPLEGGGRVHHYHLRLQLP